MPLSDQDFLNIRCELVFTAKRLMGRAVHDCLVRIALDALDPL